MRNVIPLRFKRPSRPSEEAIQWLAVLWVRSTCNGRPHTLEIPRHIVATLARLGWASAPDVDHPSLTVAGARECETRWGKYLASAVP